MIPEWSNRKTKQALTLMMMLLPYQHWAATKRLLLHERNDLVYGKPNPNWNTWGWWYAPHLRIIFWETNFCLFLLELHPSLPFHITGVWSRTSLPRKAHSWWITFWLCFQMPRVTESSKGLWKETGENSLGNEVCVSLSTGTPGMVKARLQMAHLWI